MTEIERAGVKDHGVVTGLLEEVLGARGWRPEVDRDRWDWLVAELLDADSWLFLLARDGDEPAGIAVVNWRLTLHGSREQGRLEALLVLEGRRSEGIGTMLMESVLNASRRRGCRQLEVCLPGGDESSLEFFRRFDFTEEKRLLTWPCDE